MGDEEQRWLARVLWSDQVNATAYIDVAVGGRGGGARSLVWPCEGGATTTPTAASSPLSMVSVSSPLLVALLLLCCCTLK